MSRAAIALGVLALTVAACSAKSSGAPPIDGMGASTSVVGSGGSSSVTTGGSSQVGTTTGGSSVIGSGTAGATTGTGGVVGSPGGSTGVSTGGAATGVGGATSATTKLCATKVTAASTQIANFENYDGMMTVDKYVFAFGGATDGTAGVYAGAYGYAGGTDAVTLAILAGHTGNYGLTESTTPATSWGEGLGFWMGCVNASAYKGVTFWVRGTVPSNNFSFSVSMESTSLPDATNAAAGGTCPGTSDTCKSPAKTGIPITMDWTQASVMWADLTGGLSGTTAVVANGDSITGFTFLMGLNYTGNDDAGYTAVPGDISFAIDDIAFIP